VCLEQQHTCSIALRPNINPSHTIAVRFRELWALSLAQLPRSVRGECQPTLHAYPHTKSISSSPDPSDTVRAGSRRFELSLHVMEAISGAETVRGGAAFAGDGLPAC
jgi:hypothetical protein